MFQPPQKRFRPYHDDNHTLTSLELNENDITQPLIPLPKTRYRSDRPRFNLALGKFDGPMAESSPAYSLYLFFSTAAPAKEDNVYIDTSKNNFVPPARPVPIPPAKKSPVLVNIERYAFQPEPQEEKLFETKHILKAEPKLLGRKKLLKNFLRKKPSDENIPIPKPSTPDNNSTDSKSMVGSIKHFFKRASPKKFDSNHSLSKLRKRRETNEHEDFEKSDVGHTTLVGSDVTFNEVQSNTSAGTVLPEVPPKPNNQLDLKRDHYPEDHFLGLDNVDGGNNEDLRGALMYITRFQPSGEREIRYSTFDMALEEAQKRLSKMRCSDKR